MNKSIFIKDIVYLLNRFRPGRFDFPSEYQEWLQNQDILALQSILHDNVGPKLVKVSLDRIHSLFERRWREIAGSPACYTGDRKLSAENEFFIALAEHIAKFFPERYSHYYKLLMPSVENLEGQFLTTLVAVIDTPLNQLIVSDNHTLLCIPDIIEFAVKNSYLANVEKALTPLSLNEKEQLLRDRNARAIAKDLIQPTKALVVNLSFNTVDQVRLLGIGCLHGIGKTSKNAIGAFYEYTQALSQAELTTLNNYDHFKTIFDLLIAGNFCIYESGRWFCTIALDFIRDESQWQHPVLHEQFSKNSRDYLRNSRKRKICADVYEKIDLKTQHDENSVDEERANRELHIIKSYIEQKQWHDLTGVKTISLNIAPDVTRTMPLSLKPVYDAIVNRENSSTTAIELLILIKERFQQRYFAETTSRNVEVLAFYRSFYTNHHIAFMEENLHQPEQQLEPHPINYRE